MWTKKADEPNQKSNMSPSQWLSSQEVTDILEEGKRQDLNRLQSEIRGAYNDLEDAEIILGSGLQDIPKAEYGRSIIEKILPLLKELKAIVDPD